MRNLLQGYRMCNRKEIFWACYGSKIMEVQMNIEPRARRVDSLEKTLMLGGIGGRRRRGRQ